METHLVVIVHGMHGTPSSCDNMKNALQSAYPNIIVYISKCNATTLFSPLTTHDGIDAGGERLAKEVREVIQHNLSIDKISFIGISLGGLYVRYAIGLLLDLPITFFNFITFATPHLGIRNHSIFEDAISSGMLGRTGIQLMLSDGMAGMYGMSNSDNLLMQMTTPESKYITGLQRFGNRVLVANTIDDDKVPYDSASIRDNTLEDSETDDFKKNRELYASLYPHVTFVTNDGKYSEPSDPERLMMKNLRDSCPFINVDVTFNEFGGSLLNHLRIACTNSWLTSVGDDVLRFVVCYVFAT